jgi:hypothetical protein
VIQLKMFLEFRLRGMLEEGRKNDPNFPPKKGFWGFLGYLGDAPSKIYCGKSSWKDDQEIIRDGDFCLQ